MAARDRRPVIFLAFANDREDGAHHLRNLAEETRRVWALLDSSETRRLCEPITRQNATRDDIFRVFEDDRYRGRIAVFHFGGHAGGSELMVETAEGAQTPLQAGPLADFLGSQEGLRLVFLNGCSTDPQVERLLGAGVPAVIATTAAVSDPRATELAIRFYAQLAGGERIDLAHERASSAAQSLADDDKTRELLRTAPADGRFSSWKLHVQPGREAVSEWSLRTGLGLSSGATADLARRYRSAVAAELSRIEVPASHLSEEERPQLERVFVAPGFVPVADIGTVGGSLEAPVGSAGSETLDLSKVLGAAPQMVLLGDMGAGKSTLLRYMALRYAAEGPPTGPGLDEDRIPVFIDLAEYASDYEERRVASLLAYLRCRVAALLAADEQTAGDFLTSLMDAGALCLCLDGLDKVGAARERKRVVAEIIALATDPSKNRIVVTTRSPGYNEAPLGAPRFKSFRILPPSKEATSEVLTRWSGEAGAELARVVEERQLELGSFLLATIVALIYRRDGTLPRENDAEYVGRFVTHILDSWDKDPAIEPRERSQPFYGRRAELLGAIGYGMQARQTNDEPGMLFGLRELEQIVARAMADEVRSRDEQRRQARRFVELLRYRSGLLVSRTGTGPGGDGAFAFWHPSVQEYLTARHVADRLQESADSGWSLLARHVVDPRWEGVFHLTLGCLREDEAPAELVLERLMAGEVPYERVLHRALFLAARVSARAPWLPPEVIQPIIKQLVVLSASDDAAQYAAVNYLFWFTHHPEAAHAISEDIARWENVGDVLNAVDALDALTVDQAQPLIPRIREIAESPPETLEYGQWLAACRLLARLGRPGEARTILRRGIEAGTRELVEALQLMHHVGATRDEVLELLRAAIAAPSQQSSPLDIAGLFEHLGRREEGIAFLRTMDGRSLGSVEVAELLEHEGLPDDALRILRQALAQPSRAWAAAPRLVARDPGARTEAAEALAALARDPGLDGSTLIATVMGLAQLTTSAADSAPLVQLMGEPRVLRWAGAQLTLPLIELGLAAEVRARLDASLERADLSSEDREVLTYVRATFAVPTNGMDPTDAARAADDELTGLVSETWTAPWQRMERIALLRDRGRVTEAVAGYTALAASPDVQGWVRGEALRQVSALAGAEGLERAVDGIPWTLDDDYAMIWVAEMLGQAGRTQLAEQVLRRLAELLLAMEDPIHRAADVLPALQAHGVGDLADDVRTRSVDWAGEQLRKLNGGYFDSSYFEGADDNPLDLLRRLGDRQAWAAEVLRHAEGADAPPKTRLLAANCLVDEGPPELRRRGLDVLAALSESPELDNEQRYEAWSALDGRVTSEDAS